MMLDNDNDYPGRGFPFDKTAFQNLNLFKEDSDTFSPKVRTCFSDRQIC